MSNSPASAFFHMRRCHICGAINTHPITVRYCQFCKKQVSPFFYYDERAIVISENKERPFYRPELPTEYGPLIGLTLFWNETEDQRH